MNTTPITESEKAAVEILELLQKRPEIAKLLRACVALDQEEWQTIKRILEEIN